MDYFEITAKDKRTKARVGILKTKNGTTETPFFMPVATKASVKHVSSEDLKSMNCKALISNTFILHLKPGERVIKHAGGIGRWMNFSGINLTDSGGFQMYSNACYIKSTDFGVYFKNPFTQNKIFISPEKDMQIQNNLNSDIAMCLDSMPLLHNSKEEVEEAVRRTTIWAGRCKKEHNNLQKNKKQGKRQLLFCIMQGGVYPDLRRKSASEIVKIGFDGYALGGLALGETFEQEMHAVEIQKQLIPEGKIVYLMGAGSPVELMEAISRGVDMFDSRFPTKNARHGYLFTSQGVLRIFNSKNKESKLPIDKNCDCFVCKSYARSYICHQLKMQEGNGYRLASYHNLYYLTKLMEQSREAIKKGRFLELKNKVKRIYRQKN